MANHLPIKNKAIVLFAHGSPDPDWHTHIRSVETRILNSTTGIEVCSAYLGHTEPDLKQAISYLADKNITHVTITPLFLGVGKHLKEDLPTLANEVQMSFPSIKISIQPPIGEHPQLIELMAKIALE